MKTKNLIALVLGLGAAFIVTMLSEMLMGLLFPFPKHIDMKDAEQMKQAMLSMPTAAFLTLALGWGLGAGIGGFMAAWRSVSQPMWQALMIGGIQMLMGIINLAMLPHPAWLWVVGLSVFLPFAYLGGKIGSGMGQKETDL